MTHMNITQEQYDNDIRNAKAQAWEECAELTRNWASLKRLGCDVDDIYNHYEVKP